MGDPKMLQAEISPKISEASASVPPMNVDEAIAAHTKGEGTTKFHGSHYTVRNNAYTLTDEIAPKPPNDAGGDKMEVDKQSKFATKLGKHCYRDTSNYCPGAQNGLDPMKFPAAVLVASNAGT